MSERNLDEMENLFLALSDKTRLRILGMMREREVTVGEFTDVLGESQPKVSRHLAYLRSAGLVSTRRDGKWVYYHIAEPDNPGIASILSEALRYTASPNDRNPTNTRIFESEQSNAGSISNNTYISDSTQGELEIYLL